MNTKILIGCHVSISGNIAYAFDRAISLCANTFQIFVKNPRGWQAKKISEDEKRLFREKKQKTNIKTIFAHISYLPNLAAVDKDIHKKSLDSFLYELEVASELTIPYFIVHCGSYKNTTLEKGMQIYADSIIRGLEHTKNVTILIENTAGGRNSFGGDFKLIAKIIEAIGEDKRVKVCIDTAHAFAAGYDLRTSSALERTLKTIEETIGLERVAVFHTNDSAYPIGSHRDKHQHIGLGEVGMDGFKAFASHPFCQQIPWILETPVNAIRSDQENIQLLLKLAHEQK